MGVVYRALDTHLNRAVAIKVLPQDRVVDPDRKRRFLKEARAASALNHPNIITVHDIRSEGGVDFIVMEYAEGRTLEDIIPASGLGVTEALRYGVQIADALGRAHEAGIVDRDLKPSNVMIAGDGRVKVLDFGLAKLLEPEEDAESSTRTSPLTGVGSVVGTAAYMSPEQAEGRKIDARSDIFSFGVLLYEMVTGRRPFAGDSNLSILAKILNEDPAPPSTISSVTNDVERTILRCLRKDPGRRPQTMADLKVALQDLAADSVVAPAVAAQSSASQSLGADAGLRQSGLWRWMVVAVVLLIASASLLLIYSVRSREKPASLRAVPLAALPGMVRSPSFSPDGNHVAFMWTGKQDNPDIYVQQIGAGSPLQLTTNAAQDYSPSWAPDGRAIAFLRQQSQRQHELRLVPPLGGPERKVADLQPRGFLRSVTMAWCPDSTCVVVTDSSSPPSTSGTHPSTSQPDALFVVSVQSSEKRQLTTPREAYADTDPAISPDGRWLVFRRDLAPFSGRLHAQQLGPGLTPVGEPRTLTPLLLTAYGPKFISNTGDRVLGERLAVANGHRFRHDARTAAVRRRGRHHAGGVDVAARTTFASRLRPKLRGHEYLAGRHAESRCAGGVAAFSRHLIDPGRPGPGLLGRWEGDLPLRSLRRVGGLDCKARWHAGRSAHVPGGHPGVSEVLTGRYTGHVSHECRGTPEWLGVRRAIRGRAGAQRHQGSVDGHVPLLFTRRCMDLFQLRSERRAVHLENSSRGRYGDTGLAHPRVDGAGIERRRVSVTTSKVRRCKCPGRSGRCLSGVEHRSSWSMVCRRRPSTSPTAVSTIWNGLPRE